MKARLKLMHMSGFLTPEFLKLEASAARKISCNYFTFSPQTSGTLLTFPEIASLCIALKLPKMQLKAGEKASSLDHHAISPE
jgi:hypothetical protein